MPSPPKRFGPDFSPEELEFARGLQRGLGAAPGVCPSPDLLRAEGEGALPEEIGDRVRRHLQSCPACAQLQRDWQQLEPRGPSREQLLRMRAAIPSPPRRATSGWLRWMAPALALAAMAIAAALLVRGPGKRTTALPQPAQPIASGPRTVEVAISKPPIEIPATMLPARGASQGDTPSLDEWARALKPYRDGNLEQAVREMDAIAARYPKFGDAYFYDGAAHLLMRQDKDAASSLAKAEALASGERKAEVDWYFGAAEARLGQLEQARRAWTEACGSHGPYAAQSCDAAAHLTSAP